MGIWNIFPYLSWINLNVQLQYLRINSFVTKVKCCQPENSNDRTLRIFFIPLCEQLAHSHYFIFAEKQTQSGHPCPKYKHPDKIKMIKLSGWNFIDRPGLPGIRFLKVGASAAHEFSASVRENRCPLQHVHKKKLIVRQ